MIIVKRWGLTGDIMRSFNCKRCGYCCTLIPKITVFEAFRIWFRGYRNFTSKDGVGRLCIKLVNNDCFFLERKGKVSSCKIYNFRPKVCRDFPYGEKNNFGGCRVDKRSFKEKYLS